MFTSDYKLIKDQKYIDFLHEFDLNREYPNQDLEQPYIRHKTEGVNKYANNYRKTDIALAPLYAEGYTNGLNYADNLSNRYQYSKSALKFAESSMHKVALIASQVPTYTHDSELIDGKNIIFINPDRQYKDWLKKFKYCINNPNFVADIAENAYIHGKNKYDINVINKRRADFLKSIV